MRLIPSSTESTNRGINYRLAWRLSPRYTHTQLVLCRFSRTYLIRPQANFTRRLVHRCHSSHQSSTTIFPSRYTLSSLQISSFSQYHSTHTTRSPLNGNNNSLKLQALSFKNLQKIRTSAEKKRRHKNPNKSSKTSKIRCHSAPYTKTLQEKVKKFLTFR